MSDDESRTIEIDDFEVTFSLRRETVGACMGCVLSAHDGEWSGIIMDGLDGRASLTDFADDDLREMYRSIRHMRADLAE